MSETLSFPGGTMDELDAWVDAQLGSTPQPAQQDAAPGDYQVGQAVEYRDWVTDHYEWIPVEIQKVAAVRVQIWHPRENRLKYVERKSLRLPVGADAQDDEPPRYRLVKHTPEEAARIREAVTAWRHLEVTRVAIAAAVEDYQASGEPRRVTLAINGESVAWVDWYHDNAKIQLPSALANGFDADTARVLAAKLVVAAAVADEMAAAHGTSTAAPTLAETAWEQAYAPLPEDNVKSKDLHAYITHNEISITRYNRALGKRCTTYNMRRVTDASLARLSRALGNLDSRVELDKDLSATIHFFNKR